MKILHVYRTYYPDPPGGLQEAIRQIAVSTRAFNVESRVFTLSPNPMPAEIQRDEARVIRRRSLAAPASCDIGGISSFLCFAEAAKWADVIHYHFPWPFADLLHQVVHPKVPAIMTYHSDIVRQRWLAQLYNPLMRQTLKSMVTIVATSPAYAQTSPVLSAPDIAPKVRVIPLGIDASTYQKWEDASILGRLNLSNSELFFLFIGVLRYYKGVHYLIEAALHIKAKVVVAGSGPELAKLKVQAQQLGASNIIFAGQINDEEKVFLLRHCRALVLPSHLRSEAYGMVLVEASMFGKPMISCEIGTGTSFVNADGVTGIVIPPENSQALAKAMELLLENDALVSQFGDSARIRYQEMFSGEKLAHAYCELYRNCA